MKLLVRFICLVALSWLSLQIYFFLHIAFMRWIAPQSSSFERSEAWRLVSQKSALQWQQEWVPLTQISKQLQRAVIASEDSGFIDHNGVDWDALEAAWDKNQRAQERAKTMSERQARRSTQTVSPNPKRVKVIGGSTITQQLAKNLFLSSEQNFARKGQEMLISFMLEAVLPKERILEIYLNHVEWGSGVFGAQAAAKHYIHTSAQQLSAANAARLAVMLPAPKKFEKRPASAEMINRATVIQERMSDVELP
jgi:monofunctional glycosyltransferase